MNNALIGGAVGSLITIFFTFIFQLIQNSINHRFKLRKTILERKLIIAEAASSLYTSLSSNLRSLSMFYHHIHESGIQDLHIFRELNSSLLKQMQKLGEASINQTASSLLLYFDIEEDNEEDKKLFNDFYDLLCNINIKNNIFLLIEESEATITDVSITANLHTYKEQIVNEIIQKLSDFACIAEEISNKLLKVQKSLRKDIRSYEKCTLFSRCISQLSKIWPFNIRRAKVNSKKRSEAGGQAAPSA